jgi:hypothetical protein
MTRKDHYLRTVRIAKNGAHYIRMLNGQTRFIKKTKYSNISEYYVRSKQYKSRR